MKIKDHFFLGIVFSLSLYLASQSINIFEAFLIFFGSFFIDFDIYLYYVFTQKNLSLKKAYNWGLRKKKKFFSFSREKRNRYIVAFRLFHNIESLIIALILGYIISDYFFFISIGMTFHLALDFVDTRNHHDRLDKISLINDYLKYKKLKKL